MSETTSAVCQRRINFAYGQRLSDITLLDIIGRNGIADLNNRCLRCPGGI